MSDTPRTDEAEKHAYQFKDDATPVCESKIVRQLERELNAANQRIKRLEEAGDSVIELCQEHDPEFWIENINTYIAWQEAKETIL